MKSLAILGSALALAFTLSACGTDDDDLEPDTTPETSGQTTMTEDAPGDPASGVVGAGTHACDDGFIEITESDIDVRLTGVCSAVTIRANDVEVDAENISELMIEGNDNDIDVTGAIGTVTISGDENEIESSDRIGTVTINGNDNDIDAPEVGDVTDNGRENEIDR